MSNTTKKIMLKTPKRPLRPVSTEVPYLISVATRDVADKYLLSIKKLEDSIEPRMVWVEKYPGHLRRLDEILREELDSSRWWIFTDTGDVTFQRPFPDFRTFTPGIIVCDEGTTHINDFWEHFITMYPIFTPLLNKPVYNAGTVAMPGYLFKEYIKFFRNYRDNYLPEGAPQFLEQLIFNAFVQSHIEIVYEVPQMFTALCCNWHMGLANKNPHGTWTDVTGKPFVAVHKNGDTKIL